MAISATTLLNEIQTDLIEDVDGGVTWASGHWTATEVYNYISRRFSQFLKDTQVVVETAEIPITPEIPRLDLNDNRIMGIRIAWRADTESARHFTELRRGDSWETDNNNPTSSYDIGTPRFYTEGELPPPTLQLFPAPDTAGELECFYVALPTGFSPVGGSNFTPLPDEFVTYVNYGVLADMLGKVGRGTDLARAVYCEQRYKEGVELAKLILRGLI